MEVTEERTSEHQKSRASLAEVFAHIQAKDDDDDLLIDDLNMEKEPKEAKKEGGKLLSLKEKSGSIKGTKALKRKSSIKKQSNLEALSRFETFGGKAPGISGNGQEQ